MQIEILKKYNKTKYLKLLSAIAIDLAGLASYVIPLVGESVDWVWGPISGLLIWLLFPNRKPMAILGVAEELIPFVDFIPTASVAWILDYVIDNKKTQSKFEKNSLWSDHNELVSSLIATDAGKDHCRKP